MSEDISSALQLVTPPANEPLSLSQAKAFLRIDYTTDDALITTAITAARQHVEQYLRLCLLPQTWKYTKANPASAVLTLPVGPAQTIASITLTNEAGTATTMSTANYRLGVNGFAVYFTNAPQTETLAVQYSASAFATIAAIPAPIIQGMLYHVAVMVEARDGSVPLPAQSTACYHPFRRIKL